jgi:hypothetical protein
MFQPLYPWEKELVAIVEEAGWASRLIWTGAENITPKGIRFLDCSAQHKLLSQLHYPSSL